MMQPTFANIESGRADKWGFFIYRTCYYHDSPGRWTQFMERLKEFASTKLLDSSVDPEGDGAAIIDKLEWNVQGHLALEGCSVDDVRRYQYFVFIKGRRMYVLTMKIDVTEI